MKSKTARTHSRSRRFLLTSAQRGAAFVFTLLAASIIYSASIVSPRTGHAAAAPPAPSMTAALGAFAPAAEPGPARRPLAVRSYFGALGTTALPTASLFQAAFTGESVATFEEDCTTPKTSFNLGDDVCVKVDGAPLGASRRLVLGDPSGFTWEVAPVTSDAQTTTFTLPTQSTSNFFGTTYDNRGTWRVTTIDEDASARSGALLTVHDPQVQVADLTISKVKLGAVESVAGENISFQVYVWNGGPDPAQSVTFSDTTLPNTTFQSLTQDSGPTFTCTTPAFNAAGASNCTRASMLKGEAASFTIIYKVSSNVFDGTELTDTVSVSSSTLERRSADNSSTSTTTANNPTPSACTMACPSNIIQTAAQGQEGAVVTFDAPATNNCGSGPVVVTPASGSFFAIGTSVVTATTGTGESCSFTVTVNSAEDTAAPSISCPTDITVPESSSASNSATVSYSVTATDDSGTANVNCNPASGSSFPVGTTNVVCTATDPAGNTATCAFDVTVTEAGCTLGNTPPTPSAATLPSITRACGVTLLASDIPTATDSCGEQIVATTNDPLNYSAPGTYTIDWTYTDANNNTATQTQTVTVSPDSSAPVPDAASLPTLTGECSVTVTETPTATDNCFGSGLEATTADPLTYNTPGTHTVHWKFTDAAGNVTQQNQTVVVTDGAAPVPSAASLPTLADECSVTLTPPTAQDNCGGTITATTNDPLTYTAEGTHTVHWTYTDAAGNTATQNQTVVIDDTTAPVPAAASLPTLAGECSVTAIAPTAADNCAGTITATTSDPTTYTEQGTYTIHWTYNDGRGNTATQNQTVVVDDNTAPTITAPAAVTLYTGPGAVSCGVTVGNPDAALGTATAADNCAVVSVNRTGVPAGGVFPLGQTTLTYTATDVGGNSVQATQVVTVVDNTAPTLVVPNVTVSLPLNSPATSMAVGYPAATTSDNCAGAVSVVYSPASGSVFPVGTSAVTATATDAHGNTTTATFTVTVLYNFTGFFSPVGNLPTLNTVNAGRAIPLKFSLSGNKGFGIMAAGYPASQQVTCNTSAPISELEGTVTSGGSTLTYSPDQYHYNWKTENGWAGTCRVLVVKLNDGTEHTAAFKFK